MAKSKTVTKQTIKNERAPGGDIPESVAQYIALHPSLFVAYAEHEADTKRIMQMSTKGISKEDAEQVAWLIWRARMVRKWTQNAEKQDTMTWAAAVESAWLKDELFKLCSSKRKAYYAGQEARYKRLEQKAFTREQKSRKIQDGRDSLDEHAENAKMEHDSAKAAQEQAETTAENAA